MKCFECRKRGRMRWAVGSVSVSPKGQRCLLTRFYCVPHMLKHEASRLRPPTGDLNAEREPGAKPASIRKAKK